MNKDKAILLVCSRVVDSLPSQKPSVEDLEALLVLMPLNFPERPRVVTMLEFLQASEKTQMELKLAVKKMLEGGK